MATAPDLAPVKQMEALLECSICMETLTQPRTLSCFHSFCTHCLANFVATQKEAVEKGAKVPEVFECPVCRTTFQVKEGESVEKMPSNHLINNMLELLTLQQQAQNIKCQSCKAKNIATNRCVSCENYLCGKCLETHNNWPAFEDHVVFTLEELAKPENQHKARAKPCCQKNGHENKPFQFYCDTCQELACINCVVLNHPKPVHDYQPIDVVAEQHKKVLKTTFDILRKKADEGQNVLKKIKDAAQILEDNTKKARDAILKQNEEILNEFSRQLEVKTTVLLGEVDGNYYRINDMIDAQQNVMSAYLQKVNGSLLFAENIIQNGSNDEILSLGKEIKVNASDIDENPPKLMDLSTRAGCMEYQAKSTKIIFDSIKLVDLGNVGKSIIKCAGRISKSK